MTARRRRRSGSGLASVSVRRVLRGAPPRPDKPPV